MVVSALAQVAGHYFDWHVLLGKPLPRLGAYVYGTLMVFSPLAIYFVLAGEPGYALILGCTVVSAGLSVIGCYALDSYLHMRRRLSETEQRETELRKEMQNDKRPA